MHLFHLLLQYTSSYKKAKFKYSTFFTELMWTFQVRSYPRVTLFNILSQISCAFEPKEMSARFLRRLLPASKLTSGFYPRTDLDGSELISIQNRVSFSLLYFIFKIMSFNTVFFFSLNKLTKNVNFSQDSVGCVVILVFVINFG